MTSAHTGSRRAEHATVCVIGAGVAGLIVADRAARAGQDVLLLDAAPTPGGCVARHVVAGLALDAGAESFATRSVAVADLARDLGLGDRIVTPDPVGAWVAHRDGSWPLPRAGLLGIPTDLDEPSLAAALDAAGLERARRDAADPVPAHLAPGASPPPSLGDVVRARMGEDVLDRLVRPIVSGVHAADPDALDVQAVAPGLLAAMAETGSLAAGVARLRGPAKAGSAVASLRGGMHVLVDALAARVAEHGGRIRLATPVAGIDRDDDGWRLHLGGGGADGSGAQDADGAGTVTTDRLVLATGGADAVRLLGHALPGSTGLPEPVGAPITLATLVVRCPALDTRPRGTGVLVGADVEGVEAKALTHATAKWTWLAEAAGTIGPSVHVLRLSYGRPGDAATAYADDERVLAAARRDAATLLGLGADPSGAPALGEILGEDVVRWGSALPQAGPGHAGRVARIRTAARSAGPPGSLAVVGGWLAGNGLAAVVADSQAQAAQLFDAS